MPAPTRFVDEGQYLAALAREVLVRCIRCRHPGTVNATDPDRPWAATFVCSGCDLSFCSSRQDWVGPVQLAGRRPCGHCGHQWLAPRITQRGWPRGVIGSVCATCSECGRESSVALESHRLRDPGGCQDPHFGLPLLLVDEGRFGALWAYNAEHLAALKGYVGAALRERGSKAGNKSMFSRLPAWMKAAKNRESVARRLARLERLLPNPAAQGDA